MAASAAAGIAVALFATLAVAAEPPVAPNHPIIGTWRFTVPDGSCAETYRFRGDGTSLVTSGEEVAETEFRVSAKPSRKGFYEWVDTIVKDNGKKDCAGQITDVGRRTTTYIQFDARAQRFIVCQDESLEACFGPLRRVGGEDI
ncbi:MAG: hypothetical protein U1F41_02310 [Burkholderiales bacterium]